jgi:hypothetical protein
LEYEPAWHATQEDRPWALPYVPGPHSWQQLEFVAPGVFEKEPLEQVLQNVAPGTLRYVPSPQPPHAAELTAPTTFE